MDFYHTWIYEKVINSKYLILAIVYVVMAFNLLAPVILWLTFSGRKIKFGFGKNIQKDDEPQAQA